MEMRFILKVFLVISPRLTCVYPTISPTDNNVQGNLHDLLDSINKNDMKKTETYRKILGQEALREQQAFDAMKSELRLARPRNDVYEKRNIASKNGNTNERAIAFKREASAISGRTIARPQENTKDSQKEEFLPQVQALARSMLRDTLKMQEEIRMQTKKKIDEDKLTPYEKCLIQLRLPLDTKLERLMYIDRYEAKQLYSCELEIKRKEVDKLKEISVQLKKQLGPKEECLLQLRLPLDTDLDILTHIDSKMMRELLRCWNEKIEEMKLALGALTSNTTGTQQQPGKLS